MFRGLFSSASTAASKSDDDRVKTLTSLLESMIHSLVDEPSKVELTLNEQEEGMLIFELKVAKPDLGKVIGKKGRTASAMRTILSAAARKYQVGSDLRILD